MTQHHYISSRYSKLPTYTATLCITTMRYIYVETHCYRGQKEHQDPQTSHHCHTPLFNPTTYYYCTVLVYVFWRTFQVIFEAGLLATTGRQTDHRQRLCVKSTGTKKKSVSHHHHHQPPPPPPPESTKKCLVEEEEEELPHTYDNSTPKLR